MIGKVLGNRYEIVEKIGDGGTAFVYKGIDNLLNRYVTIKILRPEFVSDQDFLRRFRREAQSAASLSHPNIVSIYDVGAENGIHYIIMEYVKGRSLKAIIEEEGPLPVDTAVEYAEQIAIALDHAHKHGIIHRDVKPHNILIGDDERVKVTDFGIARAATASTVTYNGAILGSVHYFSPEQARGEQTGIKSDIYSLGIVLFEMLTGQVPYSGESPVSIAVKHLQEPFPNPRDINPEIPVYISAIIRRAVAKDPEERFNSAREMAEELDRWLQGKEMEFSTIERPPVINPANERKNKKAVKRKKNRAPLVVAIILTIAVLALLAYGALKLLQSLNVPEVIVPNVEGETWEAAYEILTEKGLKPRLEKQVPSDTVDAGRIISQDPKANRTVKEGREVSLVVSTGPELVVVESVIGKTRREAILILDNNFEIKVVEEYSQEPVDTVIDQDPGGGHKIAKGSEVTIWVSKGTEPVEMIVLVGRTLRDTQAWLDFFGILTGEISYRESYEYPEGYIIEQYPPPGEMVQAGDFVDLVVSEGPGNYENGGYEPEEPEPEEPGEPEKPEPEEKQIIISTEEIPAGASIKVIINDEKGRRENEYINDGNPITVTGWGSGTVEVIWGSSSRLQHFS
jgi:serine/threonine-protein kinase